MSSKTALVLINQGLRITGDYEPLTTVVGSPANIADRMVDFLNLVLDDICKKIEFPELFVTFEDTATGTDSQFIATGFTTRPRSGLIVSVDTYPIEEVSHQRLHEIRSQNLFSGIPQYFARIAGSNGELGIDIYPTPASGAIINLLAAKEPTKFTVADASVTEVQADDLLLLGLVAHMDAYSGMERGYMQLYEAAKARSFKDTYEHQAFRIQCESYR